MTDAAREWLSTHDVADLLAVSPATVRYWRHRGTGPRGVNLGRQVRYRRVDVEAWVEDRAKAERRLAV